MCVYIYMFVYRLGRRAGRDSAGAIHGARSRGAWAEHDTANLRTHIMDFTGLNSSKVLIIRGGILMSIGDFPETYGQPAN